MPSKAIILTAMVLALSCSLPAVSVSSAESHSNMTQGSIKCDELSDCDAAIKAIERARKFFEEYGYVLLNQSVKVQFKKSLLATMEENSSNQQKVHGLYDSKTGWCEAHHWKVQSGRKLFGSLDMTKEFHLSIITHEVAHHFYHLILSQRNETVSRSLHEFVAYVVQIHTMKKPEKQKFLTFGRVKFFQVLKTLTILRGRLILIALLSWRIVFFKSPQNYAVHFGR